MNDTPLDKRVKQINKKKEKKPKIKHEKQVVRDPIPQGLMVSVLKGTKLLHMRNTTWKRFQLMATVLFYTGLRAGELKSFTRRTLLNLIEKGEVDILQTKTNAIRKVIFSDNAREVLKMQLHSIDIICPKQEDLLYPFKDTQGNKLIEAINSGLEPYEEEFKARFSSYSFRAGYITQLLGEVPAQHVQELVGHADIRSTMQDSRVPLTSNAKRRYLD